jgi:hypothetical protein
MADTLTQAEVRALRELERRFGEFATARFNFAVGYLQEHAELDARFSMSDEDLRDFRNFLADSGVELSSSAFEAAKRFIRLQVEREVALQAWGDVGEFERIVRQDRIIRRAVELLAETSTTLELLEAGADPARSDWLPVAGSREEPANSLEGVG